MTRLAAASPFSSSAPVEKLKSHSGTKKRFFPTASGLVSASVTECGRV